MQAVGNDDDIERQLQKRGVGLLRVEAARGDEVYDPVVWRAFIFSLSAEEAAFASPCRDVEIYVFAR